MGDPSTHVIFYSAYWYLVYESHGFWVSTQTWEVVCALHVEEKLIALEDA